MTQTNAFIFKATKIGLPIRYYLLALIAGCLVPLAFSPYSLWPLAILSPAFFLSIQLRCQNKKTAFFSGWLFGFGLFGIGTAWVYISIHEFGGTNAFLAAILTALFVIFLGFWFGVLGLLFNTLYRFSLPKKRLFKTAPINRYLLLFPACWCLMSWLFTWVLTGFPWLNLGISQINSPLAGYLSLFGILGVTTICAFEGALLFAMLSRQQALHRRTWACFFFVVILLSGVVFNHVAWSHPLKHKALNVSLIQGNVPQSVRWDPNAIPHIMMHYQQLSMPYFQNDTLIVWPENALPTTPSTIKTFLDTLANKAKANNTTLITGIPVTHKEGYYNSMMMLGAASGHYYKRHLVPFGEYLPFDNLLRGLIGFFDIPMSDFLSGPHQQKPLIIHGITLAPLICYEIAYSQLVRQDMPKADIILTISDDAWFGDSAAALQQLDISRAQAIATARPLIAASNNGITAIIDPKGDILKLAPRFHTTVLTGKVSAYLGTTPWVLWGNWPCYAFMLLAFIFTIWRCLRR